MIVAVTNLETIPDDCQPCPFRLRTGSPLVYCNLKDRATFKVGERPEWCPLVETKNKEG